MYGKSKKLVFMLLLLSISAIALAVCVICVSLMGKPEKSETFSNTEIMEEVTEQEDKIKVACIGDSITYGLGVTNLHIDNYPTILQSILGDEYYVVNFGHSGACVNPEGNIPYIEQNVYQRSLDFDADIIIFMLGSNDTKGINWNGEYRFMRDYLDLIESYLQDGRQPKIYIALCPEGFTNPDTANEHHIQPSRIDKIVETIRNAYIENAEIIDIHSLTEAHPEWFSKDGIHPDAEGTKGIAEMIAEAIKAEKQ